MITQIKWIVIGIILVGFIAMFIWGDKIPAGSVFAGLAGFVAAIKSKLFGNDRLREKIGLIKSAHEYKRRDWEIEKKEYEERYYSLQSKIDTLNKRIEDLDEQLDRTTKPGYKAGLRTEEEILFWLKNN